MVNPETVNAPTSESCPSPLTWRLAGRAIFVRLKLTIPKLKFGVFPRNCGALFVRPKLKFPKLVRLKLIIPKLKFGVFPKTAARYLLG